MMRVLILGGYGSFGRNIANLLADENGLTLVLAGRSLDKATRACESLKGSKAVFEAARIDRAQDMAAQIKTPPQIIIDATGPFQLFKGTARESVISYALKVGAHYADLSDDTEFIAHIQSYDSAAKTANITALSGLSTYPVLTTAIVEHLRPHVPNPTHLLTGIAPSPQARLGKNVLAAILSGAGRKAVYQRQGGRTHHTFGLTKTLRKTIASPLGVPLKPLIFAQTDSPESLFLTHIDSLKTIKNYAGPQPVWMMRLLIMLSRLARFRLFPPLRLFTSLFHKLHGVLTYGPHRSGYFVTLKNKDLSADFHLTAEGDDGPIIPAIPAAIFVKKHLRGYRFKSGARSGALDIGFQDYADIFAQLNIQYGHYISRTASPTPVYRRLLGEGFETLAGEIQSLHDIDREKIYKGRANITRGKNPLGSLICALFGFPKAGQDIEVSIRREPLGDNLELWERRFNGRKMRSTQAVGTGRRSHMIIERFGPIAVNLTYTQDGDRYRVATNGWRAFGIPMPKILSPYGDVYERAVGGKFHFHVELCVPLIGRLVTYIGWFNPTPTD